MPIVVPVYPRDRSASERRNLPRPANERADHRLALHFPSLKINHVVVIFAGRRDHGHLSLPGLRSQLRRRAEAASITTRPPGLFPTNPLFISKAAPSTPARSIGEFCSNHDMSRTSSSPESARSRRWAEDFPSSWKALFAGRDAAGAARLFDTSGCRCHHAASARPCPSFPICPRKAVRRFSRASRLAIPAAREALASAGLLDAGFRSRLTRAARFRLHHRGRHGFRGRFFPQRAGRPPRASFQPGRPLSCRSSRSSICNRRSAFRVHPSSSPTPAPAAPTPSATPPT